MGYTIGGEKIIKGLIFATIILIEGNNSVFKLVFD